jgi:hypothetical protein
LNKCHFDYNKQHCPLIKFSSSIVMLHDFLSHHFKIQQLMKDDIHTFHWEVPYSEF